MTTVTTTRPINLGQLGGELGDVPLSANTE